jgi:hypothetical protein
LAEFSNSQRLLKIIPLKRDLVVLLKVTRIDKFSQAKHKLVLEESYFYFVQIKI